MASRNLIMRAVAGAVVVVAAVALLGFVFLEKSAGNAGVAAIGGPFQLTSQAGKPFSDHDLAGKPFTVFFGFTHCPEVCPTTLWEMTEALKTLGSDAEKLNVVFISVDPERDTPQFMADYLQAFDHRIIGLTGSQAAIDAVGKAYKAYWKKVPTDDGDYTMDHTAVVYLMDARGQFVGTIAYDEAAEPRIQKLKNLIKGEPLA